LPQKPLRGSTSQFPTKSGSLLPYPIVRLRDCGPRCELASPSCPRQAAPPATLLGIAKLRECGDAHAYPGTASAGPEEQAAGPAAPPRRLPCRGMPHCAAITRPPLPLAIPLVLQSVHASPNPPAPRAARPWPPGHTLAQGLYSQSYGCGRGAISLALERRRRRGVRAPATDPRRAAPTRRGARAGVPRRSAHPAP
jgi:hypothetical protein